MKEARQLQFHGCERKGPWRRLGTHPPPADHFAPSHGLPFMRQSDVQPHYLANSIPRHTALLAPAGIPAKKPRKEQDACLLSQLPQPYDTGYHDRLSYTPRDSPPGHNRALRSKRVGILRRGQTLIGEPRIRRPRADVRLPAVQVLPCSSLGYVARFARDVRAAIGRGVRIFFALGEGISKAHGGPKGAFSVV